MKITTAILLASLGTAQACEVPQNLIDQWCGHIDLCTESDHELIANYCANNIQVGTCPSGLPRAGQVIPDEYYTDMGLELFCGGSSWEEYERYLNEQAEMAGQ